jgi:hypothetical protein
MHSRRLRQGVLALLISCCVAPGLAALLAAGHAPGVAAAATISACVGPVPIPPLGGVFT